MGDAKTVLMATEKAFAADAVLAIEKVCVDAGYTFKKLENYKEKSQLLEAVKGVDAIIVRSDKMDMEVYEAATSCKIIVRAGAGVDTIDLKGALDKDIVVMNTPGQNSNAVAELAFGMMLANARNHWDGSTGYELKGKTLGLHGYGQVARNMQRLANGFGMEVSAYDPFIKPEDITAGGATPVSNPADLFKCQFVSLHIPATPETIKSINKDMMMSMPKKGVIVNTARKEVIDDDGMIAAFAEREDLSYVCDVGCDIEAKLNESKKRAFCTAKKMGAATSEANNNAGIAAARQIVDFFQNGVVKFQVNKPGQTF